MSLAHRIHAGVFGTLSFIVVTLSLPVVLILTTLVLIARALVTIIFKVFYNGKFMLMNAGDCSVSIESYANLITINNFIYVKGNCTIDFLRERMLNKVVEYEKNGCRPYAKLKFGVVQRFGFTCWEDLSDTFDIRNHVRVCPGLEEEGHRPITEREMYEAVAKLVDTPFPEGRPRWEMLLLPKVRLNSSKDTYYVFVYRVYHPYMDGLSMAQAMGNCMPDKPSPLFFDPVNPPLPEIPFYLYVLLYIQVFLFGPYTLFKLMVARESHIFHDGAPLVGPKFMTRSTMDITLDSVKHIRQALKCSTTSLFNSCLIGALRRMAERKGLPVPDNVYQGSTVANVPYPNEFPQNRFSVTFLESPIGLKDPLQRLKSIDARAKQEGRTIHKMKTIFWLSRVFGIYPTSIVKFMWEQIKATYIMTNLPSLRDKITIDGNDSDYMVGVPPIGNGMRYGFGVNSYFNLFQVCFFVESSPVISSQEEVEELSAIFEKEFKSLESLANSNPGDMLKK